MSIEELKILFGEHPELAAVRKELAHKNAHVLLGGLYASARALALAQIGKPLFVFFDNAEAAQYIYADLRVMAKGEFSVKAKTILAEAGEHMNMNGGYGVSKVNEDGSYEYTPTRHSSSWISLVYGGKVGAQEDKHPQKLQGILFAGYIKNFGTKSALWDADQDGKADMFYFPRGENMNQMWRLTPTLLYTVGKFQVGIEYDITSVQYGKGGISAASGLAEKDLHWVTNHRVQIMTKFNF